MILKLEIRGQFIKSIERVRNGERERERERQKESSRGKEKERGICIILCTYS